ncbi:MAG: hypothetical protein H7247_07285, partial [Polaromonas sp.]|nr:hypothetical protein [Gemmatimonadaceae bacterium]
SIGSGIIQEREATVAMAELRATINATEAELDRSKFAARRTAGMATMREKLITLAQHFSEAASHASGPVLRELVRPWLASATHDKQTRMLTLRIRRIPEVLGMDLHGSRRQTCEKKAPRLTCPSRSACWSALG